MKKYEEPKMELVLVSAEALITTSNDPSKKDVFNDIISLDL